MATSTPAETFERPGLLSGPIRRPHRPIPLAGGLSADDSSIPYQDEREQLGSALQIAWSENIGEGDIQSSLYRKVAVLLISWDIDCDDLDTKNEVSELERVFQDVYHYKVRKACLTCKTNGPQAKLPQVQMQRHLANFVYDEDDRHTLLIIYYAGHGAPGADPRHFELSGTRVPTMHEVETVKWHLTEASLQETMADVFLIFDCCYAGDASRSNGFGTRSFEFLAATSAGSTTKSPGPRSFTSGLIWALLQFVEEGRRFTTSELTNKIKKSPGFPERQVPTLSERNAARIERIILAPLAEDGTSTENHDDQDPQTPHPDTREILLLNFVLDRYPERDDVARLAQGITNMVQTQDLLVRRVIWGGIHSDSPLSLNIPIVYEAIKRFREAGEAGSRRRSFLMPNDESLSTSATPSE